MENWIYPISGLLCLTWRAAADLLEDGHTLEPFDVVHFASFVADPQRELLRLVAEEAGHPGLSIQQIPWWMLRVIGLFSGIVRELIELRYLFDDCVILDGSRLRKLLPQFADTPVREAVRETLESYRRSPA